MTGIVRASAENDILRQVERYATQGLPAIGRRFAAAAQIAIVSAMEAPALGQPHPAMAGLHTHPIKGFTDFTLYCLMGPNERTVLRVLHTKRDIENGL